MVCNVRLLKSRIESCSSLEEIITSSNEVIVDFESDMALGIRNLGNPTQTTAEGNDIVKQTAGS